MDFCLNWEKVNPVQTVLTVVAAPPPPPQFLVLPYTVVGC